MSVTHCRIMVVDDEAKMRRVLEIMLEQMGYEVLQAANGKEALALLSAHAIDLIITDLKMPECDGIELLRQLNTLGSEIPVIVVTAYATIESAVDAMKYGACDYIVRPFELNVVETAIQRGLKLNNLQRQNRYLRHELAEEWQGLMGNSPAMTEVYTQIRQVAPTAASVLIQGETGTGKELVARAIHKASLRANGLFISINCAAIPANMLESELFGYNKGAFTGAIKDHIGKFELADGGTLFLDEITEMDINLQTKLLRVLQERTLERLGSNRTIAFDTRIIASTNRNPRQAIAEQKLREDLFYRINVFTIELPPLRQRSEDILPLAYFFIKKHVLPAFAHSQVDLTKNVTASLLAYHWPGNVRELENIMERAVVLSGGKAIGLEHLPQDIRCGVNIISDLPVDKETGLEQQVERLEKQLIQEALLVTGDNKAKAAKILDISERSLWYKLKKYWPAG